MVKMKVGSNPRTIRGGSKWPGRRSATHANSSSTPTAPTRSHRRFAWRTNSLRQSVAGWRSRSVPTIWRAQDVRSHAPIGMDIAAGEYGYTAWYFRRMIDAGAVTVLQADATRCGGITGFMDVAAFAGQPISFVIALRAKYAFARLLRSATGHSYGVFS